MLPTTITSPTSLPPSVADFLSEAFASPPPSVLPAVAIREHLVTKSKEDLVQLCADLILHSLASTPPVSIISPPLPAATPPAFEVGAINGATLRERFMNGNEVLELPYVDPLMSSTDGNLLAITVPTGLAPILALSPTSDTNTTKPSKGLKRVVSTANVTLQSMCWSDDEMGGATSAHPVSQYDGSPTACHGSSGTLADSFVESTSRSSVHRRHVLPPELINEKFEVYGRLSAGRTADVFHALDLERGVACAIKAIPRKHVRYLDTGVPREAEALLRVEHPNISKLLSCIDDPSHDNVYLVLDLVENCVPLVIVNSTTGGAESSVSADAFPYVVAQVCAALQYMHSKNVVHGDLKPDNVVVSTTKPNEDHNNPASQHHVTILDLGAAVFCERRMGMLIDEHSIHLPFDPEAAGMDSTAQASPQPFASPAFQSTESEQDPQHAVPICLRKGVTSTGLTCVEPRRRRATRAALREAVRRGTQTSQGGAALFSAPELFDGAMPTRASDVWALGVILFAAIYGALPFFGTTTLEVREAVLKAQLRFPTGDLTPEQRLWRPVVRGMLEADPFDRMKLVDVHNAAVAFVEPSLFVAATLPSPMIPRRSAVATTM